VTDITVEQYFGQFANHPDVTDVKRSNAYLLLGTVNTLRERAENDGVTFVINPHTGNYISGNGHGGFRPEDCSVGADNSPHKDAHAVDSYDPERIFAKWCRSHESVLADLGLHMEREEWTPTWVHLQDIPPRSGKIVFVPSSSPPLASSLA